jgi:hypothetical protein
MTNELLMQIKNIVSEAETECDRLPSQVDQIRIDAFEQIRSLFGYPRDKNSGTN